MGQLRRFTVQNGKGNCVAAGCIARCVFGGAIVYLVLAVLGKFDINRLGQQVVPRVCLGFCQPVSAGFQIFERVICNLAVRSGYTGQIIFVVATEFVASINRILRFSFGCFFGSQLFQLELNIFQEYFFVIFAFFRVLLDDIQSKLRVLQLVGQLNLAAAAGDGSIGGYCGCIAC